MPDDTVYLPVFVGKENHPESDITFQGDNTGENISAKNPYYNELTAIYWGWKNLDVDALGLVHYRRYLSMNSSKDINKVLSGKEIEEMLQDNDIILPSKRRYFVETNESHYRHAHHNDPFDQMQKIIYEDYPEYKDVFEIVMKRTYAHMFNMFIMKEKPLDEYCTWMFSILNKVEPRIDITDYTDYEKRVYGFLSELLLDVWLEMHPQYKTVEVKYVFMEPQNWFKKGGNFLLRKLKGRPTA